MSILSDFGQGLKQGGAASFGQGVHQGVSLVQSMDQARQQKREREWQKDITMAKMYMEYAGTKGVTPQTSADSVNQANGILMKWYPDMKFPQITPQQMPDFAPRLKTGNDILKSIADGKMTVEQGVGQWGQTLGEYDAENLAKGEISDREKTSRESMTNTLKQLQDSRDKKNGGADGMTPEKAMARMTELTTKAANLGITDPLKVMVAEATGVDPKTLKMNSDDMRGARDAGMREFNSLQRHIPEDKQVFYVITEDGKTLQIPARNLAEAKKLQPGLTIP